MTVANYKAFVDRMIQRYEGGYGWDAGDSGGPTKFGITCYDLAQHRHQPMRSMSQWAPLVRAMPLSEAEDIYAQKYALQCRFDDLRDGCDCVVFDFGVNSGSSRAISFAQHLVGVPVDGVAGPITVKAINDHNAFDFINGLCDARMAFLRRLGIWSRFGVGWSSRVADLRHYALALVPRPQHEDKLALIELAHAKAHAHFSPEMIIKPLPPQHDVIAAALPPDATKAIAKPKQRKK